MQKHDSRCSSWVVAAAAMLTLGASFAVAQSDRVSSGSHTASFTSAGPHNWVTPKSSVEQPGDAGIRAHTNWVFGVSNGALVEGAIPSVGTDVTTVTHYETPSSMGCLYKIPGNTGPCVPNINSPGGPQRGGWGAIAIVDAYDNPYAASELATFDTHFGLPTANFVKVYANGNGDCTVPPFNAGWGLEESLDIEWAHVMAPKATIILVEACSNSYTDLLYAETVAAQQVASYGGGDVTNSWSSGEFSGELADDVYFGYNYYNHIVYFASADDAGCGAAYPSSSPWLVSAGGTTVNRKSTNLAFSSESCWAGSGGGSSTVETYNTAFTPSNMGPWANYQYPIFGKASRQTPDFAFNADPNSGVVVYDCAAQSGTCNYYEVGGTSVSSPALAGIVNAAANKLGTADIENWQGNGFYTAEENNLLYSQIGGAAAYVKNFYDVKTGSNGCTVGKHWDYCTGVGSPRGLLGK